MHPAMKSWSDNQKKFLSPLEVKKWSTIKIFEVEDFGKKISSIKKLYNQGSTRLIGSNVTDLCRPQVFLCPLVYLKF